MVEQQDLRQTWTFVTDWTVCTCLNHCYTQKKTYNSIKSKQEYNWRRKKKRVRIHVAATGGGSDVRGAETWGVKNDISDESEVTYREDGD